MVGVGGGQASESRKRKISIRLKSSQLTFLRELCSPMGCVGRTSLWNHPSLESEHTRQTGRLGCSEPVLEAATGTLSYRSPRSSSLENCQGPARHGVSSFLSVLLEAAEGEESRRRVSLSLSYEIWESDFVLPEI